MGNLIPRCLVNDGGGWRLRIRVCGIKF